MDMLHWVLVVTELTLAVKIQLYLDQNVFWNNPWTITAFGLGYMSGYQRYVDVFHGTFYSRDAHRHFAPWILK